MDPAAIAAWWVGLPLLGVWLVLGASAFLEYVFPPFPGDTVVVVGAVWAVQTENSLLGVMAAVTLGALLGVGVDWWLGRRAAHRVEALPDGRREQVERLVDGFRAYGPVLLVANRFVPGIRALFFVAAGVAELSLPQVMAWAALSAVLWNAVLLLLGAWVGWNLELLLDAVRGAGLLVSVGLALGAAGWGWRWWRARR